jgi:hypothetical protein
MKWLIVLVWYIIALTLLALVLDMVTAIGAFSGVLLLVAVGLFTGGFYPYSLGFKVVAIWVWVASGIFSILGFVTIGLFIKLLLEQRKREKHKDWLEGNF